MEVLYGDDADRLRAVSADGRAETLLSWDRTWFAHLWLVTVSGADGLDLCLLPEPSTAPLWQIAVADELGVAISLPARARRTWWIALESNDSA